MIRCLALLLLLDGCQVTVTSPLAKLNGITQADLATAQKLAAAIGDVNGVACWIFLTNAAMALAPPDEVGAATTYELYRMVFLPAYAAACGPVGLVPPAAGNGPIPLGALFSAAVKP